MALGKEGNLGTGKDIFAECLYQSTRQIYWRRGPLEGSLPSASPPDTRQRGWWWGPLDQSLPRASRANTRQNWPLCRVLKKTLGKGSVTVTWRRDGDFSLPSVQWHSAKFFAEYPTKSTRQRGCCRCTVCRAFFAECYTRQSLCRVLHSAKPLPSVK